MPSSQFFSQYILEPFVDPAGESDENGMDGINIVNLEDSSLQQAEPEQEREQIIVDKKVIIGSKVFIFVQTKNVTGPYISIAICPHYHWSQILSSNENVICFYILNCHLSRDLTFIFVYMLVQMKILLAFMFSIAILYCTLIFIC